MQVPQTRWVQRPDGRRIAYQEFGTGPLNLVIVPGIVSHLDLQWTDPGYSRLLVRLAEIARVVLYDKPGTGVSDPVDRAPSIDDETADLELVLDAAGCEDAVLMGFSHGFGPCVVLAARRPERVRALIAYGSFIRGARNPDDRRAIGMSEEDYEAWYVRLETMVDRWGQGEASTLVAPSLRPAERPFWAVFERASASPAMVRALFDTAVAMDITDLVEAVGVPTLVLHRPGDRMIHIDLGRLLASRIPGAQFVELPGIDHAFWVDDPDPFVDEVAGFLAGTVSPGAPSTAYVTVLALDTGGAAAAGAVDLGGGQLLRAEGTRGVAEFARPAEAVRVGRDLLRTYPAARSAVAFGRGDLGDGGASGGRAVELASALIRDAFPGELVVSRGAREMLVGSDFAFEPLGRTDIDGEPTFAPVLAAPTIAPSELAPVTGMAVSDRAAVALARRTPTLVRLAGDVLAFPRSRPAKSPPRSAMQPWVRIMGDLDGDLGSGRLAEQLRGRQVRLLFLYLLLHRDQISTRDRLAAAVWPDEPPLDPEAALRSLLSRLRRSLGPDLVVGRGELRLALPVETEVDLEDARDRVEAAAAADREGDVATLLRDAREAAELLAGDLAAGLDAPWLDEARGAAVDLRVRALELQARAGSRLGGPAAQTAVRAARELVALEPYRETSTAVLMDALAACGDRAEALRAYDELRGRLREELGVIPGPELRNRHTALLDREERRAAPRAV